MLVPYALRARLKTSSCPAPKRELVERFARGDESRTTEGNGLGLAIVNTYAAALGGAFEVAIDCAQFKASVEFIHFHLFHMELHIAAAGFRQVKQAVYHFL